MFLYNYTQFWQLTLTHCLRHAPFLARPRASSLLLWRMKNSCSHLELPWTMSVSRNDTNLLWLHSFWLSLSLMLRPTVKRPVSVGIKHPSGAYDQILITVRYLRVCWCGALSLTRVRVCRLLLLLVLASAVILVSESHWTRDHDSQVYGGGIRPCLHTGILLTESYITTDGQSVSLSWNKAPIWGLRPNFYYFQTVTCLLMWGALSDKRTDLSFKIAAGLASAVILGSESRRSRDHILLSQIRGFPFRHLLRLIGLRWKNSTPPPHVLHPSDSKSKPKSKLCYGRRFSGSVRIGIKHPSGA
jgi:hypothetical protein